MKRSIESNVAAVPRWTTFAGTVAIAAGLGCSEPSLPIAPAPPTTELAVGDTRTIELRYLRFDVENFERELSGDDLRSFPPVVVDAVWLLDLHLGAVITGALLQLKAKPQQELQALPQATRNLQRLLTMTPDTAEFTGTSLEALSEIAGQLGLSPARVLADLLDIAVTDEIIDTEIAAAVMLEDVVGTHPATRSGPAPEGQVAPGAIAVTLGDVLTQFAELEHRFGPAAPHPGFVGALEDVAVTSEEFGLTARVNANALPFKGVDATTATPASVASIDSQYDTLYDTSDPDWLQIHGLVAEPSIGHAVLTLFEAPTFVAPGSTREPAPFGDSAAWSLDPWLFERLLIRSAYEQYRTTRAHCDEYMVGDGIVALRACVDEAGWVSLETLGGLGSPPPPAYIWDLVLEIGQARLHDGGLGEGQASAEIPVSELAIGPTAQELIDLIRANLAENLQLLRELTVIAGDNSTGAADFYYYRSKAGEDWLVFVEPLDIAIAADGGPTRPYGYEHPGFYADPELERRSSTRDSVDGDASHEKLRIIAGTRAFVEDDARHVFQIDVGDKPSPQRIELLITRVR